MDKLKNSMMGRILALVLVSPLALLASMSVRAQAVPVHSLTMPFVYVATDPAGGWLTFNGQVTFETQRVADPTAGDALLVNVVMTNLPATSNTATAARYTTTIRETVMKPWSTTSVPVVVDIPLVWQSGGANPGPRTATVDWTLYLQATGAPMTSWINSVVVAPPSPPPPAPPSAGTWVRCAAQGGVCYFPGTTTVRFTDPTRSLSGTATATTLTFCLPHMFGLPFYAATTGYCEYRVN